MSHQWLDITKESCNKFFNSLVYQSFQKGGDIATEKGLGGGVVESYIDDIYQYYIVYILHSVYTHTCIDVFVGF